MRVVHNVPNALSLGAEVVTIVPGIKWVTVFISHCLLCLGPRKIVKDCFQFPGSVKSLGGSSSAVNLLLPQHPPWGFPRLIPTLLLATEGLSKHFSQPHVVCVPLAGSSNKCKKKSPISLHFRCYFSPCCIHDTLVPGAPTGALWKGWITLDLHCGRASEMWLVQIEILCNCKIHREFQRIHMIKT